MPTLNITDKFGIPLEAAIDRSFSFGKYFQSLRGISFRELSFRQLADELLNPTLETFPLDEVSLGASFDDDISVGTGSLDLTIEAGASAGVRIITSKDKQLDPDEWGSPIELKSGEAYVGFFVDAEARGGVSAGNFGVDAGKSLRLLSYKKAREVDRFSDALQASIENFWVVADWRDLTKLPADVVAIVEGEGSLKASFGADFGLAPIPLLSAEIPVGGATVGITAGGSVGLKVSGTLFGGYQLRLRRLDANRVALGYYTRKGSRLAFAMEAAAGISGGAGQRDLIGVALGQISSNPKADRKKLREGGLDRSRIDAIENVIKLGVQRKLEISLDAAFQSETYDGKAFLFEVDASAITAKGKSAVVAALHGDLRGILDAELPGVKCVRSVFSEVRKRKRTIRFNLLGIYNHVSISKLWLDSRMSVNPNGDITFVDQATAKRANISTVNFGDDDQKLRKVMTQSFMMSAAYEASGLAASPPDLAIENEYFELHSSTPKQVMKDNLDIAHALGALHHSKKGALLRGTIRNFGASTFLAAVSYGNAEAMALFVSDNTPRSAAEFEDAGRAAILKLIEAGDKLDYLRLFAERKSLWKEMKDAGFPGFERVYRDNGVSLNNTQASVLVSYGTSLLGWADAMAALSKQVVEVRTWIAENPNEKATGKEFQRQRKKLAKRLGEVVKKSKPKWGEPVGLVSTFLALPASLRQNVPVTVLVRSEALRWEVEA